jgi:predicted transglutaminase-like cysteine proteinase
MRRRLALALMISTTIAAEAREATVRPPSGWAAWCRTAGSDCDGGSARAMIRRTSPEWALVRRVNRRVNAAVTPMTDLAQFGRVEVWTLPESGAGDCEDFALAKRAALIAAGVPRGALSIAVADDPIDGGHAVLLVRTDRGDYVLDNRTDRILPAAASGYAFRKRQGKGSSWVIFESP